MDAEGLRRIPTKRRISTLPEFIKNPTRLIRQQLHIQATDVSFEAGRFAMACEIVSVIRTLEDFEDLLPAEHSASLISVLQTLLSDQELNWVYRAYDELSASRRRVFVPVPGPSANGDVDAQGQESESSATSSVAAAQPREKPQVPTLRALSVVRQSLGASTNDEQLVLTDEATEGTLSE